MPSISRISRAMMVSLLLLPGAPLAAELSVTVTGLRSDRGDVHIAIYDDPAKFPDGDGMLEETQAPITQGTSFHRFTALEPGRYAIAVYHDENGNDDFDTNFIGLPLEGYGFSNDARVFLGPPSFADAAIEVEGAQASTSLRMIY